MTRYRITRRLRHLEKNGQARDVLFRRRLLVLLRLHLGHVLGAQLMQVIASLNQLVVAFSQIFVTINMGAFFNAEVNQLPEFE